MTYKLIAIEREYASGGSEVGKILSSKMGIPCHDTNILEMAAEKLNLPVAQLKDLEESMTGSLLFSLNMLADITSGRSGSLTLTQELALTESNIIKDLAINPGIFVGRGAAGTFKDDPNVLKVFIHSDYDLRVQRAINVYHQHPDEVPSIIRTFDRKRSNYFRTISGIEWKDVKNYHMVLDSGKLGIMSVVEAIQTVAEG